MSLRGELYFAYTAILELMPDMQQEFLVAWSGVQDHRDLSAWLRWAVDGLLDMAERDHGPSVDSRIGQWRANCPLCAREELSRLNRGFAYPIGLNRHLSGSHGMKRCSVVAAAHWLAVDNIRYFDTRTREGADFKGPWWSDRPKPWLEQAKPAPAGPPANVVQLRPPPADQLPAE
ncbi:hypothetical protein SNE35_18710 [Paucibacter sp. R3-3]|uniref:Uncharacterized protein n=1 Tax=Roseateles agri TaxID=3098619 RepID=A0ABU5DJT4_9BURK|nr:hypothetical protein [Paucibacter sp. R3-3]MDY0746552.1 hypothetical protein [Paucibacter sp. R3-3]